MDPNVKPKTLVETFDQANYSFYLGVYCRSHNFVDLSCQHAQLSVASAVCGDCKLLYEGP